MGLIGTSFRGRLIVCIAGPLILGSFVEPLPLLDGALLHLALEFLGALLDFRHPVQRDSVPRRMSQEREERDDAWECALVLDDGDDESPMQRDEDYRCSLSSPSQGRSWREMPLPSTAVYKMRVRVC